MRVCGTRPRPSHWQRLAGGEWGVLDCAFEQSPAAHFVSLRVWRRPSGFLGVWSAPNVTAYIPNALRYLTDSPSPGVMYTSLAYSPPAYFEGSLMQARITNPAARRVACS